MKPEIKKLWVDALRSGQYTMGIGHLKHPSPDGKCRYCALGVLCDLYVKAHQGQPEEWKGEKSWYALDMDYGLRGEMVLSDQDIALHTFTAALAPQVVRWAGLELDDPLLEYEVEDDGTITTYPYKISELNDEFCADFLEMADLIDIQL